MKTRLSSVIAAVALAWVGESLAAEAETYSGLLAGSEIKGSKVKNLQNEEIGDIYEILVEPVAGQVRFAILSVGGSLGIGDTKVAIPWKAFEIIKEGDKPKWVLDATKTHPKSRVRTMIGFTPKKQPNLFMSTGTQHGFLYPEEREYGGHTFARMARIVVVWDRDRPDAE